MQDAQLAAEAVHLRPIRPDDAAALVEFHRGLSARTIYFRFFSVHGELTPREVARFTNVDYCDRMALVAVVDDRIVAVGRYDRVHGTPDAEVAFVVTDELQGHGLGTLLLEHLAVIAKTNGIERFVAVVLPTNGRMLAVFRHSGFEAQTHPSGNEVEVSLQLSEERVPRAMQLPPLD